MDVLILQTHSEADVPDTQDNDVSDKQAIPDNLQTSDIHWLTEKPRT